MRRMAVRIVNAGLAVGIVLAAVACGILLCIAVEETIRAGVELAKSFI